MLMFLWIDITTNSHDFHFQSARRELERQRQMEWERQRKEQLMAEKTREYEQLMALKSQTSNFTCELESLVKLLYIFYAPAIFREGWEGGM